MDEEVKTCEVNKAFGQKLLDLYIAANELMAVMGADGEANAQQKESGDLMDALFELDEGAYDPELVKKLLADGKYEISGFVKISQAPLRQLLTALVGPAHHIREIQATMDLPFDNTNPLKQVIDEFNSQTK